MTFLRTICVLEKLSIGMGLRIRDDLRVRGERHVRCYLRGQRTSCVHRNNAICLPSPLRVTTASHTCVELPRCTGRATVAIVPSFAVVKKLLFSSAVVKFSAPAGRCAMQP